MAKTKDFRLFRTLSDSRLPLSEAFPVPAESRNDLDAETNDISRIVHSLIEELAAFNDYNTRMAATEDDTLREVLEHNRDEEIDHAMMLLELLRTRMPVFDERIKKYLMKEGKVKD